MKQLNVYGDMQKTNALIKEFITGYEGNLTKEEEDTIKMMKDSGKVIIEKSRGEVSLVEQDTENVSYPIKKLFFFFLNLLRMFVFLTSFYTSF